jgi:hypothetical protein
VIDSRMRGRRLQYLVRWKGYGHEENLWLLEGDLDAPDLIVVIGSPRHLNSKFIFNTCLDYYLNITNIFSHFISHFCSLLGPPKLISETLDLFQTSEDYFGNFAPLKLIFPSSDTFGPFIWTIHISPDLVLSLFIFIFPCRYVLIIM